MTYSKDISVIIPHRNSIELIPKLLFSIPVSDRIEVIMVDNSPNPITKEDIGVNRDYILLYSAPERGAGGARNEGIEHAHGKWLIFADADDYFAEHAFDVFYSMINTKAEMVYTRPKGEYIETGAPSDRGRSYAELVREFCVGTIDEYALRLGFSTPWAKMVSHDLVERNHIRYDEVLASNDIMFSILTGYYARSIIALDKLTYIVTVSRGTLTRRRDYPVCIARLKVSLRRNQFLREKGLSKYQISIMARFRELCKNGPKATFEGIFLILRYRQNPFIGYKQWFSSYKTIKNLEKKEKSYIVN